MKPTLYLETTIPSYYVARPSRDVVVAGHQQVTIEWWKRRLDDFDVFISQVVLDEAALGDPVIAQKRLDLLRPFRLLTISDEAIKLAKSFVATGPIPQKAARDAAHIAIAAVHGVNYLVTWNCKHIANAEMIEEIEEICNRHGLRCPVICTPEELLGD